MADSLQDWALLPKDLLDLIAKCLETPFGRIQFRSVCSSWRSAVAAKPPFSVVHLPILPENGGGLFLDSGSGFRLSRRTVFLIGLHEPYSQSEPFAWLVKIQDGAPHKKIIDPLSDRVNSLPDGFPRVLDLSRFRVRELGKEYKLHYFNNAGNIVDSLYLEKAVVKHLDDEMQNEFVLLTIHVSGKLAVFKSSDGEWTIIHDMPSPYDDVILFNGQFYAVDNTGRTVVLDFLSMKLTLAGNPVFGGDKKFLVESLGELLLVDMYLSIETVQGGPGFIEEYFENLAYYMNERTVRFKVFRFNPNGKRWVEVENLGDRMLFLGDDCTFSASISEILPSGRSAPIFLMAMCLREKNMDR